MYSCAFLNNGSPKSLLWSTKFGHIYNHNYPKARQIFALVSGFLFERYLEVLETVVREKNTAREK